MTLLCLIGIAICLIAARRSWLQEQRERTTIVRYVPEVVTVQPPAVVQRPEPTREEMFIAALDANMKGIKIMKAYKERMEREEPELMNYPVGNGDTVGSKLGRRIHALATQMLDPRGK